jgi:hypothetical protein
MAFGTQQSGGDKNLYPSGGDVIDKAGDEKSSGQQRIGLQRGDIDGHGLMRVGDGHGVEFCRGGAEVLREQLRVAGVMRPPTLRITAASPGARPKMSNGSTRGSTQPMIIVFSDGMIFSSAEKRLLAKASLRWVKVSMTFIWELFFLLRVRWLWCYVHN